MATKQEIFENVLTSPFDLNTYTDFVREMISGVKIIAPDKPNQVFGTFAYYIASYFHIGEYTDNNGDSIGIFAIALKRGESIENARSSQRAFVKTLLERGGYGGALVGFYSTTVTGNAVDTWRLSFIRMDYEFAKGKIKESLTPAKRYSYLVGKGEPCHTAMERLFPIFMNDKTVPTLDELEEAFSVETVTKEFFEQYKEKYLEMKEFLEDNPDFVEEAEVRGFTSEQFTKKLLAQIVFLYFVQKKGWLGVNAIPPILTKTEYNNAFYKKGYGSKPREIMPAVYVEQGDLYYRNSKAFLSMDVQDEVLLSKLVKGKNWGTGPKDFMRHIFDDCTKRGLNFFDDYLEPLFYTGLNLNRGDDAYFQPLHCRIPFLNGGLFEELDNYEWQSNDFAIPNEMFSNIAEKGREADGVLDIFDRYNFTMAEDEPMEREVAVDPEMLGKVFENLLDVKDRKSKGAFYTPREIVHYMCQESLINYLVTRSGIPEEDIRKLVLYGEYFKGTDAEKTVPVDNKTGIVLHGQELYQGGYHMELDKEKDFEIPASIFSYKDGVNRLKELDDLLTNVKVVDPAVGSGAFPLGMLNEIVKARDTLSTYMAIEMSSTQKKEFYAPGFVGSRNTYDLKSQTIKNCIFACDIEPSATDIAKLRLWLSLVIDDELTDSSMDNGAFGEHSKPKQLPNLDCNIICGNSLVDSFEGVDFISQSDVLKNISGEHQETFMQAGVDNMIETLIALQDKLFYMTEHHEKEQIKAQIQGVYDAIIEEQLQFNPEILQKYRDSLRETSRPFVLWQLYFPKVFRDNGGFDIAIGNPPYVQVPKGYVSKLRFPYSEGKDKGKQNLYKVFVEQGYNLVSHMGCVTLIVQSSLMCDLSSKYTRELLLENTQIDRFIEFPKKSSIKGAQVFDSVLQGTCICMFKKEIPLDDHEFKISTDNNVSTIASVSYETAVQSKIENIYPEGWYIPLVKSGDYSIIEKVYAKSKPLAEYIVNITQGDLNLTGAKSKFSHKETPILLLRGKHIGRYYIHNDSDEYVVEDFLPEKVENNKNNVYIVGQEITGTVDEWRLHFSLTEQSYQFLFGHTSNKILLQDSSLNAFVLGVLNSKIQDWFFRKTSTNNHVMGYELKQLPIPNASQLIIEQIGDLVKEINILAKKGEDYDALRTSIDDILYSFYDLTQDEIDIITK